MILTNKHHYRPCFSRVITGNFVKLNEVKMLMILSVRNICSIKTLHAYTFKIFTFWFDIKHISTAPFRRCWWLLISCCFCRFINIHSCGTHLLDEKKIIHKSHTKQLFQLKSAGLYKFATYKISFGKEQQHYQVQCHMFVNNKIITTLHSAYQIVYIPTKHVVKV